MLEIKFHRLMAWSPAFSQMKSAALNSSFAIQSEVKYPTQLVTSQQGRRLSELTKVSVDLGLRLTQNESIQHVIFSSRHGELTNSAQLLQMIGGHEVLSPTLFSQSVHNTAVGTFSLLKKDRVSATSLSGGKNGFMMGLVSAWSYLEEKPEAQVLYLSADNVIPDPLAVGLREENISFGAAILLKNSKSNSSGQNIQFLQGPPMSATKTVTFPQTIDFLRWFFSEQEQASIEGDSMSWTVKKC